jgi:hypothetical protein
MSSAATMLDEVISVRMRVLLFWLPPQPEREQIAMVLVPDMQTFSTLHPTKKKAIL